MGAHEIHLSDKTEEALTTLCASQALSVDDAVSMAIQAYSTMIQAGPGHAVTVFTSIDGADRKLLRVRVEDADR